MKKSVRPVLYGALLWLTVFIVSVAITACATGLVMDCLRCRT